MHRRTFMTLPLVLAATDETAARNRIIGKINKLGDEGMKLILTVNRRINAIVDVSGRDIEVQRAYRRLADIYEEMGGLFRELAD